MDKEELKRNILTKGDRFLSLGQIRELGVPVFTLDSPKKNRNVEFCKPCFTIYGDNGRWERYQVIEWVDKNL